MESKVVVKPQCCPKCGGRSIFLFADIHGHCWECLSCGWNSDELPPDIELPPMTIKRGSRVGHPNHAGVRL